uniref:K+ potassium transporter integral membrane domain-containing protein n=1 Tax=Fagus sylvatica TaxID=28930 RepID=A0A2N9IXA3_FAGSY
MASSLEIDEDSDNNKGSMWVLDQKLDQPMDEEAGRLKNMYREKKFSALLLLRLAFQSLGVVYGDLGTSPLYVFYNTFPRGVVDDPEDVIGALSLIIYSLTLIPLLKYVFVVCRANDNGQACLKSSRAINAFIKGKSVLCIDLDGACCTFANKFSTLSRRVRRSSMEGGRLAACEMEVRWRFGSGAAQVWWRSDLGVATGACLRLVGDLRCCD